MKMRHDRKSPWLIALALLWLWTGCSDTQDGPVGGVDVLVDTGVAVLDGGAVDSENIDTGEASNEDIEGLEDIVQDQGPVVVTGLETVPSSSMFIETEPGTSLPVAVTVHLAYSDGGKLDVTDDVLWTTSNAQVVDIDPDGNCFVTGQAEGQATLIALYQNMTSTVAVTVKFKGDSPFIVKDGVDQDDIIAFEKIANETTEGAPSWIYPARKTVFPNGMYPPLLQWEGGENTFFRLRLTNEEGLKVTIYTNQTQYQPTRDLWLAIGSVSKGVIEMELSGSTTLDEDGSKRHAISHPIVSANASLAGSVYYWEVKSGSIMRLDSTAQIPNTVPVFSDNAEDGKCRGCHTLSPDGGKLAYSFNAKGAGNLGMAWANEPEPEILADGSNVLAETMTYGPSGNQMVIATRYKMWLADVTPGLNDGAYNMGDITNVAASGNTERAATPAWSPDGSALAYSLSFFGPQLTPGGVGSELMLRYWDDENWVFVNPSVLLPTDTFKERPYHDYPTWSPDSKWIVARSTASWATSIPIQGASGLSLVDVKTGAFQELLTAAPAGEEHYGRPAFSPFMEGGYYWLVFYSDRPYGTVKKGSEKQLWVTAIDLDATSDDDPSHPAFWLPGQDASTVNLSGYWAQPYCQPPGDQCVEDEDCCIGSLCNVPEGEAKGTCEDTGCDLPGEYCDWKSSNCCDGYVCKQSLTGTFSCQPDWSE
jgi:hypothetical protein